MRTRCRRGTWHLNWMEALESYIKRASIGETLRKEHQKELEKARCETVVCSQNDTWLKEVNPSITRGLLAVRSLEGPICDVALLPKMRVLDAKKDIEKKMMIPFREQMFVVGCTVLSDDQMLNEVLESAMASGDCQIKAEGVASIATRLVRMEPSYIYALGGRSGIHHLASAERYDPAANSWWPLPPMKQRRVRLAAAVLRGCVYAIGGMDENECALRTVERYNPQMQQWEPVAPMRRRRSAVAAAAIGNYIYVTGGIGEDDEPLASVERYDAATEDWSPLPPMRRPRAGHSVVVVGQSVLAVGGAFGTQHVGDVERFDPAAGKWIPLPGMFIERTGHGTAQVGGKVFAVGGCRGGGARADVLQCNGLGNAQGPWTSLPRMVSDRGEVSAVAIGGQVYALGGCNDTGALRTAEWFDVATGKWILVAPMGEARRGLASCYAAAER